MRAAAAAANAGTALEAALAASNKEEMAAVEELFRWQSQVKHSAEGRQCAQRLASSRDKVYHAARSTKLLALQWQTLSRRYAAAFCADFGQLMRSASSELCRKQLDELVLPQPTPVTALTMRLAASLALAPASAAQRRLKRGCDLGAGSGARRWP